MFDSFYIDWAMFNDIPTLVIHFNGAEYSLYTIAADYFDGISDSVQTWIYAWLWFLGICTVTQVIEWIAGKFSNPGASEYQSWRY